MRTTLDIDDEILAAARSLAYAQSISIGRALSELARRGLLAQRDAARKIATLHGFPVFEVPPDAKPITLEDVKRLEDEW